MKKPIVIDVMGPPNSGKTSQIDVLVGALRQKGLKVTRIEDQIRAARFEDELEKNRWAVRELGNLISEAKQEEWDIILVDRGAWAYFASVMALTKMKNGWNVRSKKRRRKARHILSIALDITHDEDFFILIDISPEKSLQIYQQFNPGKVGTVNNPDFLSVLGEVYDFVQGRLPHRKTKVINGEKDFQENQKRLLQTILSLVSKEDVNPSRRKGGPQWREITQEVDERKGAVCA